MVGNERVTLSSEHIPHGVLTLDASTKFGLTELSKTHEVDKYIHPSCNKVLSTRTGYVFRESDRGSASVTDLERVGGNIA